MEMKEMKYISFEELWNKFKLGETGDMEILFSNTYRGFTYHIINARNCYICAYIEIDNDCVMRLIMSEDLKLDVHGGITYRGKHKLINKNVIGWDYCHAYDWTPNRLDDSWHKWTTEEVNAECRNVINNLADAISIIDKYNQIGCTSFLTDIKE